jgi:hypothetical protein
MSGMKWGMSKGIVLAVGCTALAFVSSAAGANDPDGVVLRLRRSAAYQTEPHDLAVKPTRRLSDVKLIFQETPCLMSALRMTP